MDSPEQAALKEVETALSELVENRTWADYIHHEDRAMLKKALRKVRSAIKGEAQMKRSMFAAAAASLLRASLSMQPIVYSMPDYLPYEPMRSPGGRMWSKGKSIKRVENAKKKAARKAQRKARARNRGR